MILIYINIVFIFSLNIRVYAMFSVQKVHVVLVKTKVRYFNRTDLLQPKLFFSF